MGLPTRIALAGATALIVAGLGAAPSATAASCVSGQEVKTEVHALVASLRDDVRSKGARAAAAHALVDAVQSMRGKNASTPEERQNLGAEVSALAKQLKTSNNQVERKALVAQIRALNARRSKPDAPTTTEQTRMSDAVAALKAAILARTDTRAERRDVSGAFRALHEQWSCPQG